MALIKCKDCKNKFSTDAKACPFCGAKKQVTFGQICALLFLGAIGWIALNLHNEQSSQTQAQQEAQRQVSEKAKDEYDASKLHLSYEEYKKIKEKVLVAEYYCFTKTKELSKWGATSDWTPNREWSTDGRFIKIAGHDIKMKNGFNAEHYVEYRCTYDVESGRITVNSIDGEYIGITFDTVHPTEK